MKTISVILTLAMGAAAQKIHEDAVTGYIRATKASNIQDRPTKKYAAALKRRHVTIEESAKKKQHIEGRRNLKHSKSSKDEDDYESAGWGNGGWGPDPGTPIDDAFMPLEDDWESLIPPTLPPDPAVTPPPVDPNENQALDKTYAASSESQPASLAFDGDQTTRWSSDLGLDLNESWLQVDLEVEYTIDRVVIQWEFASASEYEIQLSSDGGSFSTEVRKNDGFPGLGTVESDLSGATGRFVRMLATAPATEFGYSIFEMEVFGTPV